MKQRCNKRFCRIGRLMTFGSSFAILILFFQSAWLVAATVPKTLSEVRGFNYTPASAQRSWDMWLHFNAQEVDRDFGYANELRLNQTRVFLPFGAWEQDPKTFSSSLASFMDIAYKHRIGVMLVLVPYMARPGAANDVAPGDLDARMQVWIKAVAEIVKDKPSMAFWDVQNEPDFQGPREHPRTREDLARRMHLARMFAETVHQVDKVHPRPLAVHMRSAWKIPRLLPTYFHFMTTALPWRRSIKIYPKQGRLLQEYTSRSLIRKWAALGAQIPTTSSCTNTTKRMWASTYGS